MALIPLLSAVIESADPPSGPHQPATKEAHFAILSVGLASGSTCERMDIRLRGLGCDQDTEYYLNGVRFIYLFPSLPVLALTCLFAAQREVSGPINQ